MQIINHFYYSLVTLTKQKTSYGSQSVSASIEYMAGDYVDLIYDMEF